MSAESVVDTSLMGKNGALQLPEGRKYFFGSEIQSIIHNNFKVLN